MHLVDEGALPITLNATISGLKFFFEVTLSRGELMAKMQPVSVPRTLPVFPGLDPMDPLSTRQLNRAIHAAADTAKIDKRVSMHTLRHSFATQVR